MSRGPEQSADLLATLVDHFPNGVVTLFDDDHRYLLAGGTGFAHSDLSPADLEGRRLEEVFPPENVEQIRPLYEKALDGDPSVTELQFEGRTFRVHTVPVRDAEGRVFAGMTMSQDVTERRSYERELERTKKRYRAVLEASPDPVFVAEADTGRIVEVNEAALRFRDQPRSSLVGLHQSSLHPPDAGDRYRALFEDHVETGGTKRRFPNGEPILAVDAHGTETPVAISVGQFELDDSTYIVGVFRDVSDQVAYESALTELTAATRDLFTAKTPSDVATEVVRVVTDVLDGAGAALYRFDECEGVLRLEDARFQSAGDRDATPRVIHPGEHEAWRVFTSGDTSVSHSTPGDDTVGDAAPTRELLCPLGERGVLVVFEPPSGILDARDQELVDILATTTTAALDRADWYVEHRESERELAARTRELELAETLNDQIRDVTQVLVHAQSRTTVLETVCEKLVDADPVTFAWIGAVDTANERVVPDTWSGTHRDYLDASPLEFSAGRDADPAVRAAQTGDPQVVQNTASDLTREPWRDAALTRGFQSVISVPLVYQGRTHGVLTLYADAPDAFAESTWRVLAELGELIAHALAGIERRRALLSDRVTELEFAVEDAGCFFMRAAQATDCELELDGLIPQSDDSLVVGIRIVAGDPARFVDYASDQLVVDDVRPLAGADDARYRLRFGQPIFASIWAEQGIGLRHIAADADTCTITVAIPPTHDVRQAVDVVSAMFPRSELVAKRSADGRPTTLDDRTPLREQLTDRQYEILRLAHDRGYFDTPRSASTDDLANELDISTSAVHKHLRAAEQRVVESLFDHDG